MTPRLSRRGLAVVLLVVALVLLVAAVIYLTTQCQNLPAVLPGREAGSTHHRIGYAAVAFAFAALAAWERGGRPAPRADPASRGRRGSDQASRRATTNRARPNAATA